MMESHANHGIIEGHDRDGRRRDDESHSSNESFQNASVDGLVTGNELDVGSVHFGDSHGGSQSDLGSHIMESYQSFAFKTANFGNSKSATGSHLGSHLGSRLDSRSQFGGLHGKEGRMSSATGGPTTFAAGGHLGSNMQLGSSVPASNVHSFAAGGNVMPGSNVPGSTNMVPNSNTIPGSNVHSFAAGSNALPGDHILHQHLGDVPSNFSSQLDNVDFQVNLNVDPEAGQEVDQKPDQEVHEYARSDRRPGLSSDMPSEYHTGESQSSSHGMSHSSDHPGSKSHSVPADPGSSNVDSITVSHSQRRHLKDSRKSHTGKERKERLQSGMVALDGAVIYEKPHSSPGQYFDRSASPNPHPRSSTSPLSRRSATGRSKSPLMGRRSAGDHDTVSGQTEFLGASHLEDSVDDESDPDMPMRLSISNSEGFEKSSACDSDWEKTIESHDYKFQIVFWTLLAIVVVIIAMIVAHVLCAKKIEELDEAVFNKKSAGMQPNVIGRGVDHWADADQSVQPVSGSHYRLESSEGGFDGNKVDGGLGEEAENAGKDGSKDRIVGTKSLKEKEPLEARVKRLERELEKEQREQREQSKTLAAQSKAISEHAKLLEEVTGKLDLSSKLSGQTKSGRSRRKSDSKSGEPNLKFVRAGSKISDDSHRVRSQTMLIKRGKEGVDTAGQNNDRQDNNANRFGKFVGDSSAAFLAGAVSGTVSGGAVSYLGNGKALSMFEKSFDSKFEEKIAETKTVVESLDQKFKSLEARIGSRIDKPFDSKLVEQILDVVKKEIARLRPEIAAEVKDSKKMLTQELSSKFSTELESQVKAAKGLVERQSKTEAAVAALKTQIEDDIMNQVKKLYGDGEGKDHKHKEQSPGRRDEDREEWMKLLEKDFREIREETEALRVENKSLNGLVVNVQSRLTETEQRLKETKEEVAQVPPGHVMSEEELSKMRTWLSTMQEQSDAIEKLKQTVNAAGKEQQELKEKVTRFEQDVSSIKESIERQVAELKEAQRSFVTHTQLGAELDEERHRPGTDIEFTQRVQDNGTAFQQQIQNQVTAFQQQVQNELTALQRQVYDHVRAFEEQVNTGMHSIQHKSHASDALLQEIASRVATNAEKNEEIRKGLGREWPALMTQQEKQDDRINFIQTQFEHVETGLQQRVTALEKRVDEPNTGLGEYNENDMQVSGTLEDQFFEIQRRLSAIERRMSNYNIP